MTGGGELSSLACIWLSIINNCRTKETHIFAIGRRGGMGKKGTFNLKDPAAISAGSFGGFEVLIILTRSESKNNSKNHVD